MFQCLGGPLGDLNLENSLLSLLPLASSSYGLVAGGGGGGGGAGGGGEWKKGAHNKAVGLDSSS